MEKPNKKAAKVCDIGRCRRPSDGRRSVSCPQRWLYISSLVFGSDTPPTLLPFLYAVTQADVGLFCCVLLSLPPTWLHSNIKKRGKRKKKRHMQYMDYEKSIKINTFKKKLIVLQFFSLPNTKWCFIFRLGILSYAKHI